MSVDHSSKKSVRYKSLSEFPGYRVGDDGSVWSCRLTGCGGIGITWKKLKPIVNIYRKGYLFVAPRKDGRNHMRFVHRLVLEAFMGPRPKGKQCRHRNGNVADNRLCNLKWGTAKKNAADKKKHGTYYQGEQCHQAKITESTVKKMRRWYATGNYSISAIAEFVGLSFSPARQAIVGETWKHVI